MVQTSLPPKGWGLLGRKDTAADTNMSLYGLVPQKARSALDLKVRVVPAMKGASALELLVSKAICTLVD